jgi:predicted phage replisome organizer
MATEEKKRYWLKLDKDFLKSSQIKVIKNMPNGKDYVIFYLALMLESVETIGHLRFSNLVPYNEEMLASVTDTNVDIVRTAVKIFESLGLMEILDDGTIYMTQVAEMTGKESESAERVRRYRLKQKQQLALQCNGNVTNSNDNKEEDKQSTENKEDVQEDLLQTTTNNISNYIEQNFGRTIAPIEYKTIKNWLSLSFEKNDIEKIICYAVKIAVMSNKRTFGYINGILNNWIGCNYLSYQQIIDNEIKKKPETKEMSAEEKELFDYDWLNDPDNDLN